MAICSEQKYGSINSTRPRLLVVGEYLMKSDEGQLFNSKSNKMFRIFLRDSGFDPKEIKFDNVFNEEGRRKGKHLPFFGPKDTAVKGLRMVRKSNYLQAEHYSKLQAFWTRTSAYAPNLILTLGEIAMWATTSETSLINSRGRVTTSHSGISAFDQPIKVLPTYSPIDIVRDWPLRPILLADFQKAYRQSAFPELRRPVRELWIEPDLEDLETFWQKYIVNATDLYCDIENKPQGITCFGVAPDPDVAICVPFHDPNRADGNYWRTVREEKIAWRFVHRVLNHPKARVKGQNFQHDMQYLHRSGIPTKSFGGDTMLAHHALQPEMRKGLGFLGSLYSEELAWKSLHHSTAKSAKKDDQ